MVSGGYIYKTNCSSLNKFEDVILKGICAVAENRIIIFELPLLTSVTPPAANPLLIRSHAPPCGLQGG